MKVSHLVAFILLLASPPSFAQLSAAVGKPLPSADLPEGTISVRVVAGAVDAPAGNLAVTLTAGKQKQTVKTGADGRARFDGVKVGASVKVAVAGKGAGRTSESFPVPSGQGVRVMLSSKPWRDPARSLSGKPTPSNGPAGTIDVRLTYDNTADPKPPAGVQVTLVGYAADDRVSVVQSKSDAKGVAHFTKLDSAGGVAYFALVQLPRRRSVDRLVSEPILLGETGMAVTLSAELRDSAAAPLDDLVDDKLQAGAKGKVRVQLEGAADPNMPLEIVDAATGKVVAKATAATTDTVVDLTAKAAQVFYATASSKYGSYRSRPFQMVADRGGAVAIYVYPRLLPTFELIGIVDDNLLEVQAWITMSNNAWSPYAEGTKGPTIELPRGATRLRLDDETRAFATIKGSSLEVTRPLRPGETAFVVAFELPAKGNAVAWSLDLPHGSYKSSLRIEKEPGLSFDQLPAGVKVTTKTMPRGTYLVLEDITIMPKQAMTMTVTLPKPTKDNAVMHACRRLSPDKTAMIGKPIDFTLTRLDGTRLKLSSLRGKPVLVNVMATWDNLSRTERPTLAALSKQTKIPIVMVASERDAKQVADTVGSLPFPVVLDPPPTANDNIGVVTSSWAITQLPENLLVDATGVVRYHFQNARTWDSPEAIRCVKAFTGGK